MPNRDAIGRSGLPPALCSEVEVLAQLVLASVFKTVGPYVNRAVGGFDSHALPPFFLAAGRADLL